MVCGYDFSVDSTQDTNFFNTLRTYARLEQGKLAHEMWEALQRANQGKTVDDWYLHNNIRSVNQALKRGKYITEYNKGWMWLGLRQAAAELVKDPDLVDQAVALAGALAGQHKLKTDSKKPWETVLAALA